MLKKILIIGGIIILLGVVTLLIIPWGEYESDLEKSELDEPIEFTQDESTEPVSIDELEGNYFVSRSEESEAEITFSLEGVKVTKGGFDEFEISFNIMEDYSQSELKVEIATSSINTGNGMRDEHLVEEDFFNAPKFPTILYSSSSIVLGDTSYIAKGDLTLNGSTNPLDVAFLHLGGGDNEGQDFEAFEGYVEFDRIEYGQEESSSVDNLVKLRFYCELVKD